MPSPRYKRILLKLSGEMLAGEDGFGVDPAILHDIAAQIADVAALGVEVAVVIGGGNFFRGVAASAKGMDRATADYMGMLGTIINAIALQEGLERQGVETRVQTAIEMREVAEPYIRDRAIRHLRKGRVLVFGGGTGNPYFSTDTAASLRAMEIHAEVILKATKVDGVYSADPVTNPDAVRYEKLTHHDVVSKNLRVMDTTAISLAMDHRLPLIIFNLNPSGTIRRAVLGESVGTLIHTPHDEA